MCRSSGEVRANAGYFILHVKGWDDNKKILNKKVHAQAQMWASWCYASV